MKKRRKIFQRAAALLCCILLLPSLVAVPASAAASSDDVFIDLIDYFGTQYFYTLTADANSFSYGFPNYSSVKYVDFVYFKSGGNINNVSCTIGGKVSTLTVSSLGNSYYRCYGAVSGSGMDIKVTFDITSTVWMQLASFKISLFNMDAFSETGGLWLSDSPTSSGIITMPNSSTPVTAAMKYQRKESTSQYDYNSVIYLSNWRKYDYMDVYFTLTDADISSLVVKLDGQYVPFECSVVGDPDLTDFYAYEVNGLTYYFPAGIGAYMHVMVRVDLSQLNRTDSGTVQIFCSGQYSVDDVLLECNANIKLNSVNGYILHSSLNPLTGLWLNIRSFFSDLFGKDDPAAGEAQLTQEQIDYEVNMQIVGAMENWDSNIDVVTLGFDNFFLNTQPALIWLGTLADGVFNNMGWFKNVFFTLGLFSIFMFILSKSGVAHSVGRYIGRDKK